MDSGLPISLAQALRTHTVQSISVSNKVTRCSPCLQHSSGGGKAALLGSPWGVCGRMWLSVLLTWP